jgi:hypothetical protein
MKPQFFRLSNTLLMAGLLCHAMTSRAHAAPLNATTASPGISVAFQLPANPSEWPTPASYALLLLGLGAMEALAQHKRRK